MYHFTSNCEQDDKGGDRRSGSVGVSVQGFVDYW